ncbi:MAG: DEAD/DEAH box helicase [Planctomycetaceae bacterium]
MTFDEYFKKATGGQSPYPYQREFAELKDVPQLLSVPTGVGKTATAILGWLYRRRFHSGEDVRKATPRRLVYCLPMRTLVEQTERCALSWLQTLNEEILGGPDKKPIRVSVMMGGEDAGPWHLCPEDDAILIGTQDMLLSRALNRGYAARRNRWPVEFGSILNDALWVFDEVQLMGNALATSVQIDAFGKKLWPPAVPNKFLWMSATLGSDMLRTRDREDWGLTTTTALPLGENDFKHPEIDCRLNASKRLAILTKNKEPSASDILTHHREQGAGRISLVVLNTVASAKSFYAELLAAMTPKPAKGKKKSAPAPVARQPDVMLLHSRFRSMDRNERMTNLLAFLDRMNRETGAVADHPGLILVSTQVIEAGFDLSSVALWSEIAPWASVIQRLGRLNREGRQPNAVATFWMPKASELNKGEGVPNAKRIGPYDKSAIDASRKLIEAAIALQQDGGSYRAALDATFATAGSTAALKVEADVVIRPQDFFGLFSTEPDMAGGFTNIAPYVRGTDRDVDVHVFWRDFDPVKSRNWTQSAPVREELVTVPFFEFRSFLGKAGVAYEWNFETDGWERRRGAEVQPGMTLLLPKSAGGYDRNSGWTGAASHRDFDVQPDRGDTGDSFDADRWSGFQGWLKLDQHLLDVEAEVKDLAKALSLPTATSDALSIAARWHDWGKSVSAWQRAVAKYVDDSKQKLTAIMQDDKRVELHAVAQDWLGVMEGTDVASQLWAKFPDPRGAVCDERLASLTSLQKLQFLKRVATPFRPGLRHEAGSALAAWQLWRNGDTNLSGLAVYLIASHHGKVRTILRSRNRHDEVFGLSAGDKLQAVAGIFDQASILQTDCRHIGATGEWNADRTEFTIGSLSWIQMIAELLGPTPGEPPVTHEVLSDNEPRALGPIALAYLEALLVCADVRASRTPGKGDER